MKKKKGGNYYGKYRGTVVNNIDPLSIGRLFVEVPDLGLFPTSWALPSFPFSGRSMGFWALPQIGAGVWVEFEQGDSEYPIWSGCWFGGLEELPTDALLAPPPLPSIVLQSQTGNAIVISDLPGKGGIELRMRGGPLGAKISMDDTGLTLSFGQFAEIKLDPSGVTITSNTGPVQVNGKPVAINGANLTILP